MTRHIFQWSALAVAVLYLLVFHEFSQNGRYVLHVMDSTGIKLIINSRTGQVFVGSVR